MSEPPPKEKTRCDDAALSSNEDPYCHDLTQSLDSTAIPVRTYFHDVGISSNNNIKEFLDFLSPYGNKKGLISPAYLQNLLSQFGNISRKPAALKVFLNLIDIKAATVHVLRLRLNLPTTSLYRALEFLEAKGLVVKARPLNTRGRPTTIYALLGYTPDDVAEAVQRDSVTRTSGYTEAKRIRQLLLDDYFEEITMQYKGMKLLVEKKALEIVKRECRGYDYKTMWSLIKMDPLPVDGYYLT